MSLHDALPIEIRQGVEELVQRRGDDLLGGAVAHRAGDPELQMALIVQPQRERGLVFRSGCCPSGGRLRTIDRRHKGGLAHHAAAESGRGRKGFRSAVLRSEEHTSELQSLMRISYAVFGLKNKNNTQTIKQ